MAESKRLDIAVRFCPIALSKGVIRITQIRGLWGSIGISVGRFGWFGSIEMLGWLVVIFMRNYRWVFVCDLKINGG